MKRAVIFCLVFLASCSKQVLDQPPLQYSFMPKYLDLDSIGQNLPSDPSKVVGDSLQDYKTIPVLGGTLYTGSDSVQAPMGALISEKKAAEYVFYKAEYERMRTELRYAKHLNKEYYDKSLAAEKLYQEEILRLREAAKRSWLEENLPYIGFLAGLTTAVLTQATVVKLVD